jgi:hypothetical protein
MPANCDTGGFIGITNQASQKEETVGSTAVGKPVLWDREVFPKSQILSFSSWIQRQNGGGGKVCCLPFFLAINFTKLGIILFLTGREKIEPIGKEFDSTSTVR